MTDHATLTARYEDLGWGVLEVFAPEFAGTDQVRCTCGKGESCPSKGKHPHAGTYAVHPKPRNITRYSNLGIATGSLSGLFVVDLDGEEGINTWLAWCDEHGQPPSTPLALTPGGGAHVYFALPEDETITNSAKRLGPGVDIRGEGGFVVAPPSLHAKGGRYEWQEPPAPPAEAPAWLLEIMRAAAPEAGPSFFDNPSVEAALDDVTVEDRLVRASHYLKGVAAAVEGEGGDEQTFKAASVGYAFGLEPDQFWPLLLKYNERCEPPWAERDLRAKLDNAYRYTDRPLGWKLAEARPDASEGFRPREGDAPVLGDVLDSAKPVYLARWFLENRKNAPAHVRSTGARDGLYLYRPDSGIWVEESEAALKSQIQDLDGLMVMKSDGTINNLNMPPRAGNEVYHAMIREGSIFDETFLQDPPDGLNTASGFVRVDSNGDIMIEDHAPEWRALSGVPYAIDPNVDPSPWVEIIEGVFEGDEDKEEKIDALQEFIGACLLGLAPQYQKALMLTGSGSNGKSTFMGMISSLFPGDLKQSSNPKDWSGDLGRALVPFVTARINIVNEIDEIYFTSSVFKQVVTGEPLQVRPVYKDAMTITPRAGHIFSANALPATQDTTHGFWRRFLILSFNRDFSAESDTEFSTPEEIVRRTCTPEILPGVLYWAIEGAQRLILNRSYTMPASHADALSKWRKDSDAVSDFLYSTCALPGTEHYVEGGEYLKRLYRAYQIWAEAGGRSKMSNRSLSKRLLNAGAKRSTRGENGVKFDLTLLPPNLWEDYAGNVFNV